MREWLKDQAIEVWAEDEVHFHRTTSLTRTWAPLGRQPRILSASTREKIGFFGAVSLKTGRLLTQESSTFNSETFHHFLCHLLKHTRGSILLIMDNARWHRAKALKPFFFLHQDRLIPVFLPPYSPELNPIERVWRITRRRVTHNRYFPDIETLKATLMNHFAQWESPNEALRVLCANI